MTVPPSDDAFRELAARGLIAATPPPRPFARGNPDRRHARQTWRVARPRGDEARLVLGRDLGALAAVHRAFAAACPEIITKPLFHVQLDRGEAFAESFFAGSALEDPGIDSAQAASAVTAVVKALAATEALSTEADRLAEWDAWSARLRQCGAFLAIEQQLLLEVLLPALYARLAARPAATRWSNGDFTSANLLTGPGGVRLVDLEFAGRTHFFAEDAVRFRVLSPLARANPEVFAEALPDPGPAWHLYFRLRQCLLEVENNRPAYWQGIRAARLGAIHRLAGSVLGCALPGWSVPPTAVEFVIEDARWEQAPGIDLRLRGWCHVPTAAALAAVIVHGGERTIARLPLQSRPDVQQHFGGDSRALLTGFELAIPLPNPRCGPLLFSALTDDGTLLPFHALSAGDLPGRGPAWGNYPEWATRHDPDPPRSPPVPGPLFSVLLPVFRTPPAFLRECLDSVTNQHYSRWELIVVDDGSSDAVLTAALQEAAAGDSRIRLLPRTKNGGIAHATNDALNAAAGDFIVLLDHDDRLRPHALSALATALFATPSLDVLYSDEDKITADGRRILPLLKPHFSPEFLLGVMYPGHVLCVRTAIARAAGGFDSAFDGVQDYEFFLRVTEQTQRVSHLPAILYHWRQSPGSSALHGNVKGDMNQRQAEAVRSHLRRRGDERVVVSLGGHRLRMQATSGPSHELVQCAVGTNPLDALAAAAAQSRAEILVLLEAQVQPPAGEWLAPLTALAARADSGFVAPVLLSSEGRVLASGWTTGPAGARPLMRGFDPKGDGAHGSLVCDREVAAVGPACVAVRRQIVLNSRGDWWEFCTELRTRGLFHRVCSAVHVPVDSSWREPTAARRAARDDPFYNHHYDRLLADYTLAPLADPSFRWHLDTPLPTELEDGWLAVRGWCFRPDAEPCTVELTIGGLTWPASAVLPRPDVALAYPDTPAGSCGFHFRVRVPPGHHVLGLDAVGGGERLSLRRVPLKVSRLAPLVRWLVPRPDRLLAFQMLAGPSHAPRLLAGEQFPAGIGASPPRFAIVTPSFNQARFLAETMRHVLNQRVDCQYVVQDGGSTDGSVEMIEREAPRLKAWSSAPDAGQADAIARGFARTSGAPADLMAWINSDDFYLPGALSFVADYFARHPEIDVIYGHRIVVDENSREIGRWFLPPHDEDILRLNDFVPQETLFWRRRIWDRVGGIDPTFRFAMDWDLLLRFQAAGARIVRVPYFLACFRVHAAQKTSTQLHDIGEEEIARLRRRALSRPMSPVDLENDPRLFRYLRRSAWIELLWALGRRAP